MPTTRSRIERLFSRERLSTYVVDCNGDFDRAIDLYRWNAVITAAFWEPIGHLEVALRNRLSAQLTIRHRNLDRPLTWLDDPARELGRRDRDDIATARARIRQKGKRVSTGQTISELSLGFWRFLLARRRTNLWPDLAGAFPNAPDRKRETVEEPIARLHDVRNRLAHQRRIWNRSPGARYEDLLRVATYIDPELPVWIEASSVVPALLRRRGSRSIGKSQCDHVAYRISSCVDTRSELRRPVRLRFRDWSSLDARLERVGARRMSPEEFDKHFGDLPTDGEG